MYFEFVYENTQQVAFFSFTYRWVLNNRLYCIVDSFLFTGVFNNKSIFKPGLAYKKVGVMLLDLIDERQKQPSLFVAPNAHAPRLMAVYDRINRDFGKKALFFASQGIARTWQMKSVHRSPCYTTRWSDLPQVI